MLCGVSSATAKIQPKGEKELRELQEKLLADEKAAEDAERARENLDELRIKREISEEDRLADEKQPGGPNPKVDVGKVRYDFTTGRPPRGTGFVAGCFRLVCLPVSIPLI